MGFIANSYEEKIRRCLHKCIKKEYLKRTAHFFQGVGGGVVGGDYIPGHISSARDIGPQS